MATSNIKILYLDIETAPDLAWVWGVYEQNAIEVQAHWYVLSFAAKWGKMKPFVKGLADYPGYDPKKPAAAEKALLKEVHNLLNDADLVVAHNGCVAPHHRILKADLTWVPAGELKVGDELATFAENADAKHRHRNWGTGVVQHSEPFEDDLFKLTLSDGTELIANGDHPWLVGGGSGRALVWCTMREMAYPHFNTKQLLPMPRLFIPWETLRTYESGWLSGFFEGEGHIAQRVQSGKSWGAGLTVAASQVEGPTFQRAKQLLHDSGFDAAAYRYDRKQGHIRSLVVRGGKAEAARFLGSVRPGRLLSKFDWRRYGTVKGAESVGVVSCVPIGRGIVQGLQVSSGTYVVEGFGSHNTDFDIKKLNARFIAHGMKPPAPYKVVDTKRAVKQVAAFSSNKLDWLCGQLELGRKRHHEGFPLWRGCMDGVESAWRKMKSYNLHDVVLLFKLYQLLSPWIKQPNGAIFDRECTNPVCTSTRLQARGMARNKTRVYQRYQCMDCGTWSRDVRSERVPRAAKVPL